jgi:hypothetical protein
MKMLSTVHIHCHVNEELAAFLLCGARPGDVYTLLHNNTIFLQLHLPRSTERRSINQGIKPSLDDSEDSLPPSEKPYEITPYPHPVQSYLSSHPVFLKYFFISSYYACDLFPYKLFLRVYILEGRNFNSIIHPTYYFYLVLVM